MIIKKSEFIISAVKRNQYPIDGRNEIAFVGRSNVGKSSIINALTNRKKLAKVSQTPGKTRLINFFLINDDFYLVDLPGYGYAKVSKKEKESWGKTIEMYLTGREELKRVILLVNDLGKSRKLIKETLGLGSTDKFYFFSSLNKKGKDELINNIFEDLSEEAQV